MKPETTTQIFRYEEIKLQIKELEREALVLSEIIIEQMPEDTELDLSQGKLSMTARTKWTYSPALTMLEKDVKNRQKDEQMRGVATEEKGKPYLIYRSNKDE